MVADAPLATLLRLANKSLVKQTAAGRYTLHEVVRWFAFEKLTASPEVSAVYHRFEDYYASFLRAREDQLRGASQGQALDEIGDEMDNIRVAWARCAAAAKVAPLESMLQSLYTFLCCAPVCSRGEQLFSQTVAALRPSVAATITPDIRGVYAKVVSRQAYCNFYLDRYEMAGAPLMESLVIFDELGEQREEAIGYSYLGHIARNQGDFSDARLMYEKSLMLFRALDNPRSVAVALNDLAEFLWLEGDVEAARALYEESLPVFERLGDQNAVAHIQRSLGRCAAAQGDIEGANALYERSLTTHRALDNPNAVANTLHHVGLLHLQLGEYAEASRNLETSLQDFRAIAERNGTALVLADLAEISLARGNHQDAETSYQEALTIAREIGNGRLEADVIARLGDVKLLMGDTQAAEWLFEESLGMAERLKYTQGVAYAHQRQGYLAHSRGHHEEARRRFEESHTLYRNNHILRGKAVALAGLGQVAVTHEPQEAAKHFLDALTTAVEGRTDVVTLSVLVAVAAFLQTQGQKEQALRCLALPLHHPAATRETRNDAERLEAVLIAELSTDVQSKASEKDEDLRLINAVSQATGILNTTFEPL